MATSLEESGKSLVRMSKIAALGLILLLVLLSMGCATAEAIRHDARALFHPIAAGSQKLDICSKAESTIRESLGGGKSLQTTFNVGAKGEGCRFTMQMTVIDVLSKVSKLSNKVNNLTVGDIVSLRSVKGWEEGVNLLTSLTVMEGVKRQKQPRFVFTETIVRPQPAAMTLPAPLPATELGAVRGVITDEEGHLLEGVWIAVDGESAVTDMAGKYLLTLTSGSYEIRIFAQGFDDFTLPNQIVSSGQMLVLNIVLNSTQSEKRKS